MRRIDDVSRETIEVLQLFEALVNKWNPKINLVSKSTVTDIWERHILDSAQLFRLAEFRHWADLGSGGGFPGIVIAILSKEMANPPNVTLVESDQRKSAFLRSAIRELQLNANVITQRIEKVEPLEADVLSARALADLPKLLEFAERHLAKDGTALFPKGETWQEEEKSARKLWSYDADIIRSETNPSAAIIRIKDIRRV